MWIDERLGFRRWADLNLEVDNSCEEYLSSGIYWGSRGLRGLLHSKNDHGLIDRAANESPIAIKRGLCRQNILIVVDQDR
jgi:hypothetical protein